MMVELNKISKFKLMYKDLQVGDIYHQFTGHDTQLRIEIDPKRIYETPDQIRLWREPNTFTLSNESVWQWINSRITPREQPGSEEKLAHMRIYEYDPWQIFYASNGMHMNDFLWIDFNKGITFDNHPRSKETQSLMREISMLEVIIMDNTRGQMEEVARIQAASLLSGMKKYLDAQSFNFSSLCRYDMDKNFVAAYTPNGSIFVAE